MHCDRRGTLLPCVLALLSIVLPRLASAQIGSEWSVPDVGGIIVVGDIAPDPGLEALLSTAEGVLELRSLDRGQALGEMPSPFSQLDPNLSYWLRDVDADGLAELVLFRPAGQGGTGETGVLGVVDHDGGRLVELWPSILLDFSETTLEFVDLSPQVPLAIALYGAGLKIYSSQSGAVLYDSAVAIGLSWRVDSLLIDDFDLDQRDELLVRFRDGANSAFRMDLIGDNSVATAADPTTLSSQFLWQSQPNPSSGSTIIQFELATPGRVSLRVFDTAGRRVRTLIDEWATAGRHTRQWDGRDDAGGAVGSGVYFYELDVAGQKSTRKMIRVR